jgi:hypothetical protein
MHKIPITVVHYGKNDPTTVAGGVETFARNLALYFDSVEFMTPRNHDVGYVKGQRIPVICDNQYVTDWPEEIPVIGFQHGVAAVKWKITRSIGHWRMARAQAQAASRRNTLWVAGAEWVGRTFAGLHGNGAAHVVYHSVDVTRFDGRLENEGSRLVLHDARRKHKGKKLIPYLERAFPYWSFEGLSCPPAEVADRMRRARAFVHLSRYEGNSIVCNEAMAMNLPCLFTRVGLMHDAGAPEDVRLLDPDRAFSSRQYLLDETRTFLDSLETTDYQPRNWVLANATPERSVEQWRAVMADFGEMEAS